MPEEKKKQKQEIKILDNTLWKYYGADETFIVPRGVKTIERFAFAAGDYVEAERNRTLKKVVLPNTVSALKTEAFAGYAAPESVEIPYGVKVLNSSLFSFCTNLRYVTIPDTVTKIDFFVFRNAGGFAASICPMD